MKRSDGLSSREVVVCVAAMFATILLVSSLLPALVRAREEARRIRCRNNLNQMARGMATYLNEFGHNRWYPWPLGRGTHPGDFNGAEWLASLYWTGVVPDPGVFICPSTPDTNRAGHDLGTHHATLGRFDSDTVSYAGLHSRSFTDTDGTPKAAADDFPPNEPMACDDTQGPPHHPSQGGLSVLFFDSHVEFKTPTEPTHRACRQGTLPPRLRN